MTPIVSIFYGTLLLLRQAISLGPVPEAPLSQQAPTIATSTLNAIKVPGQSPAYYCSDPSNDIFQIRDFDFIPTNVRIGFYTTMRFIGNFTSKTGANPWLNVTGSINGRQELSPLYNAALCDIDVWQDLTLPTPTPGVDPRHYGNMSREHRSCPPEVRVGYAVVKSPPMPLYPQQVPEGKWDLRAEATTQEGKRIFCIQGTFNVTT